MPLEFADMPWRVTNDTVMGGRSDGRCTQIDDGLVFEGDLSLENNGGFASVLGTLQRPVRRFSGVRLTVSGDGREYQLRLRTSNDSRSLAWRAFFRATDEPTTVTLLPSQFEPVIRGEPVIGAGGIEDTEFQHLGFMLSRTDPGPFWLAVHGCEFLPHRPRSGTCLVVGANRGIGLALTTALLEDPAVDSVIATHRSGSDRSGLEAIEQRAGERFQAQELDVTDEGSIARIGQFLADRPGGVDLVIHAAGALQQNGVRPEKSLSECDPEQLKRLFEVNSIGPLMTAKAILPHQPRSKPFTYAVLSAMVGSIGDNRLGGWYGYRASKSALNQFLKTLALECRVSHPKAAVVALHPGTTRTSLTRPYMSTIDPDRLYTPELTASRLLEVLGSLDQNDSGRFINWNGSTIPW